mgnify:FL=1|jgi:hypothetical protein
MKPVLLAGFLGISLLAQGQSLWLEAGYKQPLDKRTDVAISQAWRSDFSDQGRAFVDVKISHDWGKHLSGFYELRTNVWGSQERNTWGLSWQDKLAWRDLKLGQMDYGWRYHDDDQAFRQSLGYAFKEGRWKPKAELETWYRPWTSFTTPRRLRSSAGLQYTAKGPTKWEVGLIRQWEYSKKGNLQEVTWAWYTKFQWRLP